MDEAFRFKFQCMAGTIMVRKIDYEKEEVELEDGDIRKISDGKLLRCTGLRDKNGKMIYEGDIVDKEYDNLEVSDGTGVVHMGEGEDADGWEYGRWFGWKAGKSSLLDVNEHCTVVGNEFENTELLDVSLCKRCNCMTKTVNGICGKCGEEIKER